MLHRIGFWFINHGLYLKYYVLFIGVMTALYFIWDISKLSSLLNLAFICRWDNMSRTLMRIPAI